MDINISEEFASSIFTIKQAEMEAEDSSEI
jgi:hypothetical protein